MKRKMKCMIGNKSARPKPKVIQIFGHKAYKVIGKRVLLLRNGEDRPKLGIFQESERFNTKFEGERAAIDFIEPIYESNEQMENLAKGRIPRERKNPDNPILSLHCGIDHTLLEYVGEKDGTHVFEGKLIYVQGAFVNDGNYEMYDKYKKPLKKAGFKID